MLRTMLAASVFLIGFHVADVSANERRVAFVLANSNYSSLPALKNPINDANAIAETLRIAGFDVLMSTDLTRENFESEFRRFVASMDEADLSLVYFSGHGFQVGGENFLVPIDASLAEPSDVEIQTIKLNYILEYMRTNSKVQIVVLDACRNSPFPRDEYWLGDRMVTAAGGGLAQVQSSLNTLIAFSTSPGSIAGDGIGDLSPFSGAFAHRALTPNQEIRAVMAAVRRDVVESTSGLQVPWENSSLIDDVYLVRRDTSPRLPAVLEKTVVSGAGPVPLNLPEPVQADGGPVTVQIDRAPAVGRLLLGDRPIGIGDPFAGTDLPSLAIELPTDIPGETNLDMMAYSARNQWGGEARGIVAVRIKDGSGSGREEMIASLAAEQQALDQQRGIIIEGLTEALSGQEVEVSIGVGPVPLGLSLADDPAAPLSGSIAIASYPENGMLSLPDRVLVRGAMLQPQEVASLRYEPQVGEPGETVVDFEVRADNGTARNALVTINSVVDPCDEKAAEPLDLQGVAPGLLPNEIPDDALDSCRRAADAHPDQPRFRYQLSRALLADGRVDEAIEAMTAAANAGHVRALFQLGYMNATGTGMPVDREKANAFYKAAADRGDPYGMTSWGRALFNGTGIEVDTEQGLDLLLKAAAMGHTYPMNDLASIFMEGRNGVQADMERAVAYLRAGVQRRDIYSMNRLARMYLGGSGIDTDYSVARQLFEEAIDLGHPYAPTNLGRMYRDGVGVDANPARAEELFELAARRGDPYGAFDRAAMEMGKGERGKASTAARYFATSAAVDFRNEVGDAIDNLRIIDENARRQALDELRQEASADVPLTGDLNADLIAAARVVWEEGNPRRDLF